MSLPIFFVQECPTCGRSLQIRVSYLGRKVACPHCAGEFEACDPANKPAAPASTDSSWNIQRADELLASVESHRLLPR